MEAVDLQATAINQIGREKIKSEVNWVENLEKTHRGQGGTKGKRCYKCGQERHFAKDGVCYQKSGRSTDMSRRCYRCGKEGPFVKDEQCPARKATCRRGKLVEHCDSVCKTMTTNEKKRGGTNGVNTIEMLSMHALLA